LKFDVIVGAFPFLDEAYNLEQCYQSSFFSEIKRYGRGIRIMDSDTIYIQYWNYGY